MIQRKVKELSNVDRAFTSSGIDQRPQSTSNPDGSVTFFMGKESVHLGFTERDREVRKPRRSEEFWKQHPM